MVQIYSSDGKKNSILIKSKRERYTIAVRIPVNVTINKEKNCVCKMCGLILVRSCESCLFYLTDIKIYNKKLQNIRS